jgi:hypothetical protein
MWVEDLRERRGGSAARIGPSEGAQL